MHMADALLSPTVGVTMAAVSVGALAYSASKIKKDDHFDEKQIPMMGVMGAFVFAGQMINFTIPGTGSSGHIGGGILLAALLGPYPALLTIAAVLIIQCLFFADGGLLALGCNIFNMGVLTCLVAYPLLFKPIVKKGFSPRNITFASILATIIGLQLGAFSVVLETLTSGITKLPFSTFILFMQPIHLAIGAVEGIITAAVLSFIFNMRPELLRIPEEESKGNKVTRKQITVLLLVLAILIGGGLSLFASSFPDGLEWSIAGVTGSTELSAHSAIHHATEGFQKLTSFMPDYAFKTDADAGTSIAGIVGGGLTLLLAAAAGLIIHLFKRRHVEQEQ